MSVIELTTFTVKPEQTAAMLAARPGMVDAFRRDRRGFVSARLVRVDEHTWLDFVEWTDDTAWDASRAKGANHPEIAAFFATIDTLVSSERGARYDDAEDGRRPVRTVAYGPHPSQVCELYRPDGDGPFPVAKAVSIAGVLDIAAADADKFGSVLADLSAPEPAGAPPATRPELAPVIADHMGEGAVHYLLGGHREEVPKRYAAVVPGISIPLLSIRGTADDVVPAKYTAHPAAEHVEVPGANHFDVIDPNHPTWDIVRKWLA